MLINLEILKKTSRKQFTISNTKIVLIHCIISLVIHFRAFPFLRGECTNFREFWPVQSDVPTDQFGERSAGKISTFFTQIMSLFFYFF